MKNLLFIGKYNAIYENIFHYLENYYKVDMSNGHIDAIKGVMKMKKPEMVIISLISLLDVDAIINAIKSVNPQQLILIFGNETELEQIVQYKSDSFITYMERPFEFSSFLATIKNILREDSTVTQPQERKKVLLIDDNKIQLKIMSQMLSGLYRVSIATSASQALIVIGKMTPDVIFLDYDMPGIDGRQALEMFRQIEELKEIPIIFLTGLSDREHINAVLPLKPDGYLVKPVTKERICQEIERVTKE